MTGGTHSRTTYPALWAWVQTQTDYLIDESTWQSKYSSNVSVPFYSTGDGSTTFRVPNLSVRGRVVAFTSTVPTGGVSLDELQATIDSAKAVIQSTSGVSSGSYGPSANASPGYAGTFSVPYFTVNTYGRITAASTKTITLPSASDTKVTNTLNTSTKYYLCGTTSASTNTGTQIFDTGVYVNTTAGDLRSSTFTATGAINGATVKATSDARLKSEIVKYKADLSSLSTYHYTLNADNQKHVGLLAQEVIKVLPEAVSENEEGFYSLDYNAIVAVLVGKVNELEARLKKVEVN